ncbi:MAG: hypothetical protein K8R23_15850 [Chthoniobacter sp.]|nr:hypothetical protein [Chthoniobacter sp.]
MPFELASDYSPQGDQAQAIAKLTKSILAGNRHQTLLRGDGVGQFLGGHHGLRARARRLPSATEE